MHTERPTAGPALFEDAAHVGRAAGADAVLLGHDDSPLTGQLGAAVLYAKRDCWVNPDYPGSFVRLSDGTISLCHVSTRAGRVRCDASMPTGARVNSRAQGEGVPGVG